MRLLLVVGLLLLGAPLAAQDGAGPRTFTLPGVVLDLDTGQPVPGASVEVRGPRRLVYSDSLGRFAFANLPEGEHTFVARRLGYGESETIAAVRGGSKLDLRLRADPVVLEGVTVLASQFERRRQAMGVASYAGTREQLVGSTATSLRQFLSDRFQVYPVSCSRFQGERNCLFVRGRPRHVSVYLDDAPLAGAGISAIEMLDPRDLYRVELYPTLGQIRLYTPRYVEQLARRGQSPSPICIVCGR